MLVMLSQKRTGDHSGDHSGGNANQLWMALIGEDCLDDGRYIVVVFSDKVARSSLLGDPPQSCLWSLDKRNIVLAQLVYLYSLSC